MISFAQKTFLITGAAGGIGRATALKIAKHGAHIALSDINLDALNNVRDELADSGADVTCHQTDVSDSASCAPTVTAVPAHSGKIGHLVQSAGVDPEAKVADITGANCQQLMRINLDGTFQICRAVIPHLSQK